MQLEDVMARAYENFAWRDFQALLSAGVKSGTLVRLMNDRAIGAVPIKVQDSLWRHVFRGDRAIVLRVDTPSGDLIDAVAFRLENPRSFWLHEDLADSLGGDAILEAQTLEQPLRLHESPLEWLKSDMQGLVVLDWYGHWLVNITGVPALQFDDKEFASRAYARLSRPYSVPPMMVPA